jgi:hypothetical protein
MNVKELFENEELMDSIVEDIEDIPEDSEVTYEVWALGYNDEDEPTDTEVLVGEFANPDEAVACAEKVTVTALDEIGYEKLDKSTMYFSIEVETVVADPDDEGTINIGTIYSRDLWIDDEYGPDYEENIVALADEDYELLDDGTLKIPCKLLRDFNKNDLIGIDFVKEVNKAILFYKIISKVTYADGNYYHCELII